MLLHPQFVSLEFLSIPHFSECRNIREPMPTAVVEDTEICKRLKTLGYEERNRMRIYGEEFDLTSNPVPVERGYVIEAVSCRTGKARKLAIPLSVVHMVTKDLSSSHTPRAA